MITPYTIVLSYINARRSLTPTDVPQESDTFPTLSGRPSDLRRTVHWFCLISGLVSGKRGTKCRKNVGRKKRHDPNSFPMLILQLLDSPEHCVQCPRQVGTAPKASRYSAIELCFGLSEWYFYVSGSLMTLVLDFYLLGSRYFVATTNLRCAGRASRRVGPPVTSPPSRIWNC